MVSDSLRALAARHEDSVVSAHKAPLPASVALKIYNLAVQLVHGSKLRNMSLLQACCATIFSYFFFNRSGTTRGILNKDVASSGTDLLFYERHTKGKAGLDDAAMTLYTASHPQMAALMAALITLPSSLPIAPLNRWPFPCVTSLCLVKAHPPGPPIPTQSGCPWRIQQLVVLLMLDLHGPVTGSQPSQRRCMCCPGRGLVRL